MESSFNRVDAIINAPQENPTRSQASKVLRPLQWQIYTALLVLNDVMLTAFAFVVAYYVRFSANLNIFRLNVIPNPPTYQGVGAVLLFFWGAVFIAYGLYNRRNLLGDTQEYSLVFRATTTSMLVLIIAGYFSATISLSRGWLLMIWVFAFLFVVTGRFLLRRFVYMLRQYGYFLSPTLIVGANEEGKMLANQLVNWRKSGLHIIGFVNDGLANSPKEVSIAPQHDLPVLGKINQINDLIAKYHIEEMIIATSAFNRKSVVSMFKRFGMAKDLNLRLSSGLFETITTGLEVSELAGVPLVRVNQMRLKDSERTIKCVLDYAIGIPLLLVALPFYALVALAVKIDSPGPAFHRRRVMGINGTQFDALKFRTMHVNGDYILEQFPELKADLDNDHKLKKDPRVTRIGRFLRKTSLDETPQLVNILLRQMSLVGPRIIAPPEMEKFGKWSTNLLTVHPGLSGLWQVSGRSDLTYEDRVKLDMYYIRNWSIWMDLRIIYQTIFVVLRGQGAY